MSLKWIQYNGLCGSWQHEKCVCGDEYNHDDKGTYKCQLLCNEQNPMFKNKIWKAIELWPY